jgi:hypothetical protein
MRNKSSSYALLLFDTCSLTENTMKFQFGIVALALWQATTVQGDPINSCSTQSNCIIVTKTPIKNDGECGVCTIRVCLTLDLNKQGCVKQTGTVSHVCTDNKDTTPDQCSSPFTGFENPGDKVEGIGDDSTYCVGVAPGQNAVFIVKDGNTCADSASTGFGTCAPRSSSTTSCTGNGLGVECVWTVPTTGVDCSSLPDPKPTPNGGGDPHFRTWTGEKYSYHGACDMVLLHSDKFDNGLGMDIHIRTKHRGQYSYITTAAVRIGDDILEIIGQDKRYYLNSEANVAFPAKIAGYDITYSLRSDTQQTFLIHLPKEQRVVIKTWYELVSVSIENGNEADFGDAVGLMGDYVTGHKRARDGHVMDDVNAFGQEWQVRSDEPKLFQTLKMPQYPQECMMPPVMLDKRRRRLSEGVTEDVAKAACAHVSVDDFDFCVYDVMATNDVGMVGAY